jgi:hypothetical protein
VQDLDHREAVDLAVLLFNAMARSRSGRLLRCE